MHRAVDWVPTRRAPRADLEKCRNNAGSMGVRYGCFSYAFGVSLRSDESEMYATVAILPVHDRRWGLWSSQQKL